jgi:hypothetical protein
VLFDAELADLRPPPRKRRPEVRPAPKLGEYRELIDDWLIADLGAAFSMAPVEADRFISMRSHHGWGRRSSSRLMRDVR